MYEQVSQNKRKSMLLIASFVFLIVAIGFILNYLFGYGWVGVIVALFVAGGLAFASYWNSDKVALAMSRAEPADPQVYARLYNLVEGLCIASGMPIPRIYIVNDPAPNAFATGRNPEHAAIAVTTGLLNMMNRVELEGVLAHELSHIKNYDILVSTLAVTMVGTVAIVADFGIRALWFGGRRSSSSDSSGAIVAVMAVVLLILAPITAQILQLAVSRRRESLADVSAVEMTRYPPGLISALQKLQASSTEVRTANKATAHLWIGDPSPHRDDSKKASKWTHLFDTHPPLQQRIDVLSEM